MVVVVVVVHKVLSNTCSIECSQQRFTKTSFNLLTLAAAVVVDRGAANTD